MEILSDMIQVLSDLIPLERAATWDKVGLQVGDPDAEAGHVAVCHEVTDAVVAACLQHQVQTLVAYHPLLFTPTTSLVAGPTPEGRALALARAGVALYVVHTAFDVCEGGAADALAGALGLADITGFGETEVGSGDFIGRMGSVAVHSLEEFASFVEAELSVPTLRTAGSGDVSRVAVVPGSGGNFVGAARSLGADVIVTGDVSHHVAAAAVSSGLNVIDTGHAPSELPGMRALVARLHERIGPVIDLVDISTDPWA